MNELNLEKILDVSLSLQDINPQYINNDHTHYQRFRIENRILELMKKLEHNDSSRNHLRIVGLRDDGTYWLINGQHHTEASIRLGVESLEYKVFDSTGWLFEKIIFDKFQNWQKNS